MVLLLFFYSAVQHTRSGRTQTWIPPPSPSSAAGRGRSIGKSGPLKEKRGKRASFSSPLLCGHPRSFPLAGSVLRLRWCLAAVTAPIKNRNAPYSYSYSFPLFIRFPVPEESTGVRKKGKKGKGPKSNPWKPLSPPPPRSVTGESCHVSMALLA